MSKTKPPKHNDSDAAFDAEFDSAQNVETTVVTDDALPEDMSQEELLNKVIEYGNLSKRLAADYQNLQRESEERVKKIQTYATEQLILEIAPLVDYFNSAFAAVPANEQDSNWLQGIKHIQTQLLNILQQNDVEIIDSVGQEFNPEIHDAVSEEVSEQPIHTIIKQVQAGIKLHDRVIKPARVIVSAGAHLPASDADASSDTNADSAEHNAAEEPTIIN